VIKSPYTIVFVALSLAASGCGTVTNLQKSGPPYGGVCEAAEAGLSSVKSAGQGHCIPPMFDYAAAAWWWFIDVPASTVGDTLTLPVSIPHRHASDPTP
jgi:uncharacterized protein YceK